MRRVTFFFALFGLLFLVSCSKPDPKMQEAFEIHSQALEVQERLKPVMKELIQRSNNIQVQGRALTDQEISFSESVISLGASYDEWNKNHIVVPGFEKHHKCDGNHDHAPPLKLTGDEMISVQKEFLEKITEMEKQALALK